MEAAPLLRAELVDLKPYCFMTIYSSEFQLSFRTRKRFTSSAIIAARACLAPSNGGIALSAIFCREH